MRRFTETNKWRDPWFRKLSGHAKLLFLWLIDNCDNAGVIDFDIESAAFDIGEAVNSKHLSELQTRITQLANGKLCLSKFIGFQCGPLSPDCRPHAAVIALAQKHGINVTLYKGYVKGIHTLEEKEPEKEKEKEKEPEGVQGEKADCYSPESRVALHYLNEKSGRKFRETSENLGFIQARLSEPEVTIDGVRLMIDRQCKLWIGTSQAEYLRPETLFNATKFESYYAAKDQLVVLNQKPASKPAFNPYAHMGSSNMRDENGNFIVKL